MRVCGRHRDQTPDGHNGHLTMGGTVMTSTFGTTHKQLAPDIDSLFIMALSPDKMHKISLFVVIMGSSCYQEGALFLFARLLMHVSVQNYAKQRFWPNGFGSRKTRLLPLEVDIVEGNLNGTRSPRLWAKTFF